MDGVNLLGVGIHGVLKDDISDNVHRIIGSYQNFDKQTTNTIDAMVRTEAGVKSLSNEYMALFAVMQASQSISLVATKMTTFSSGVIKDIIGIGSSLVDVGQQFEGFQTQLNNLFLGNEEGARREMQKVIDLAKKVQGDVTDIISGAVNLRLRGMDPFAVYGETTKQELLQYAADLASSVPGKTAGEAIRAIGEAYAGQWTTMWRVFNVGKSDFKESTGKAMSSSLDGVEAIEAVVKYLESKGIAGLQEKMSKTLGGVRQNIMDVVTILKKEIVDQGFYQQVVNSFNRIYTSLLQITTDESMKNMLKQISDVFSTLWKPVDKLIDFGMWIVNFSKKLADTSPQLFKLIATLGVVGAVLTFVLGVFVIFSANILQTAASLLIVVQYLKELTTVTKKGQSLIGFLISGVSGVIWVLIKLTGVIGLLILAWRDDFLGMKTKTLAFFNDFKEAVSAINYYLETPFTKLDDRIHKLGESGNNLVSKLLNMALVTKAAFIMLFNDNTISEDLFNKLQSRGLLHYVEDIALVVFNIKNLFRGVRDSVAIFVQGILDVVAKLTGVVIPNPLKSLRVFLEWFANVDPDTMYAIGRGVGYLAGAFLAMKTAGGIVGILNFILSFFGKLFMFFFGRDVVNLITKVFQTGLVKNLFNLKGTIAGFFTFIANSLRVAMTALGPYGLAIALIIILIGAIVLNWDTVKDRVDKIQGSIDKVIVKIKDAIAFFKELFGMTPPEPVGVPIYYPSPSENHIPGHERSRSKPKLDVGGYVEETGSAIVHKGEVVIPKRKVEEAVSVGFSSRRNNVNVNQISPQVNIKLEAKITKDGYVDIKATAKEMAKEVWEEIKRLKDEDDMRSFNNVYEFSS